MNNVTVSCLGFSHYWSLDFKEKPFTSIITVAVGAFMYGYLILGVLMILGIVKSPPSDPNVFSWPSCQSREGMDLGCVEAGREAKATWDKEHDLFE